MNLFKRRSNAAVVRSESGYFDLAGRRSNLPAAEAVAIFRDLVDAHMSWADSRKRRNRRYATATRLLLLLLTAASTVILGIGGLPSRASIALPMVALVTVLGVLEQFFNWRSRWVLMEETQYRLNRLRDEMDHYLVTTSPEVMSKEDLSRFYRDEQLIWSDVSRRWVEFRKLDQPPQPGAALGRSPQ